MSIAGVKAGDIIGRDFRVVKPLAAGAMGAVYVVEQISTGKQRALKVMAAELAKNERARERFVLEARVGAQIDSAHVVEVVTAGVDEESGAPYLVMELLRGEPLSALMERRGAMPLAEVTELLLQVGHALAQAHAQGIVHRDIKPDNLFVAESRREGVLCTVKILDFGIAKLVAECTHEGTQPMGTPLFMAPEQTDRQGVIGPQTDVWPLGLIAFELLTGHSYWLAAEASLSALLREVVIDEIVPASVRAAELGAAEHLPAGFDAWFARCVDRDPQARFAEAGEAVRAFQTLDDSVASAPGRAPTAASGTGQASGAAATVLDVAVDTDGPGDVVVAPGATAPRQRQGRSGLLLLGGAVALLAGAGVIYSLRGPAADGPSAPMPVVTASAPDPPASAAPACPEGMVLIGGGSSFLGSSDSDLKDDVRPSHKVTLAPFCLDRLEVTAGAYDRCAKAGNCARAATKVAFEGADKQAVALFSGLCTSGDEQRKTHPINCVNWQMAKGYCEGEGGRLRHGGAHLPTEAQWEFAARGSDQHIYPWGDEPPAPERLNACGTECTRWQEKVKRPKGGTMFVGDDGYPATAPVGSYRAGASGAGVLDLAGNVWEWTADWYGPYDAAPAVDPTGPAKGVARVVRGGAFNGTSLSWAKPAYRWRTAPSTLSHAIGFRCAFTPPAAK